MPTILETFESYKDYLIHEKRLAPDTVRGYISDLKSMAGMFTGDVGDITLTDLRAYRQWLSKQGYHQNTIVRKTHSIRNYCHWLLLESYQKENIALRLPVAKRKVTAVRWLTKQELECLLNTGSDDTMACFVGLLAYLGLRVSEAVKLKWCDVGETIVIRDPKGKEDRELPIPKPLKYRLARIKTRGEFVLERNGRPLRRDTYLRDLAVHCARAGVAGHITPKTLRHTFGTLMMSQTGNLVTVQKAMGHKHITTTRRYAHHDPKEFNDAIHTFAEGVG